MSNAAVELNGRSYSWPEAPVVGVCIDGSEPGYIEEAVKAGVAPFFERVMEAGTNQSEQHLDRHRPAARRTRDMR